MSRRTGMRAHTDELVVGVGTPVPTLGGRDVPYVNLDNAASTPPFRAVVDAVEELLPYYASVHRGSGFKSRLCTDAFEDARATIGRFVGADPDRDVVVLTANTTNAIACLVDAMPMADDAVVLTTVLEHHSNDLPWRGRARTVHVGACRDGTLDLDDLDRQLARHAGRVALLAVSGASNVTGIVQPIHDLAARVHAVGGRILVDAAQLAAHRPIDMLAHDDPRHLDFVVLSAHKMYAPFGSGALVGRRDGFAAVPARPGGGTVRAVTLGPVVWADLPDREEPGSPNVVGAVAFAAAARTLEEIGLDRIARHEASLLNLATERLVNIPGLHLHAPSPRALDRVGVVPFTLDGLDHDLVAAILGYEHGIGVRSGCFCAHPYVAHLLGLDQASVDSWAGRVARGDDREAPGMVRISFGCYSDRRDVNRVVRALYRIAAGDFVGTYRRHGHGDWRPEQDGGVSSVA